MATFEPKNWEKRRQWLETTVLGQAFAARENEIVAACIQQFFGLHLLVLGEPAFGRGVEKSPIPHRVGIYPQPQHNNSVSPLLTRQDKLPVISDEMDLVYLAHSLEYLPNPHEVLREAYRVLRPEGHVLISVFNPWSLWGFWRYVVRYIKRSPWDGHFISRARLKDWLSILGFDLVLTQRYFFRPPISQPAFVRKLKFMEKIGAWCFPFGGASYLVLARKRVIPLTPLRETWKTRKEVINSGLAQPVARTE